MNTAPPCSVAQDLPVSMENSATTGAPLIVPPTPTVTTGALSSPPPAISPEFVAAVAAAVKAAFETETLCGCGREEIVQHTQSDMC